MYLFVVGLWESVLVVLGLAFLLVHCAICTFLDLDCDWGGPVDVQRRIQDKCA